MGKALLAVVSLLVVLVVGIGLAVYLTREETAYAVDNLLAENIGRSVATAEQDNDGRVVLSDLTDFEWDRVLVVAKGTPTERIEQELGDEYRGSLNYDAESAELFVFVRDGELVRFADYRGSGRFAGLRRPIDEFTPQTAVFEVEDMVARPVSRR